MLSFFAALQTFPTGLSDLLIRLHSYCRVSLVDPLIAGAISGMVVDDATGLQMGVDRNRTDKLKAPLFHIIADFVGQTVADGYHTLRMTVVQDGFPICVAPNIIAEAAKFLTDILIAAGVRNDRTNLALRFQHPFRIQNTLYIIFVVSGDLVIFKVLKALTEDFTLFHHQSPTQSALQTLQRQMLEHLAVIVMHWDTPFPFVINSVGFAPAEYPSTMSHTVFLLYALIAVVDQLLYFRIAKGIVQNDGYPALFIHVKIWIVSLLCKNIFDMIAVHLHIDHFNFFVGI